MDALGAPHTGERSEAQLIRDFIDKIGQLRPQLITFNGHSFDLPVLRYRAMVNRVPAAGLQVRQYFHRYAEDALDLCDVSSLAWRQQCKTGLKELEKLKASVAEARLAGRNWFGGPPHGPATRGET